MTARKVYNTRKNTDALRATNGESSTTTISAATSFVVTLDSFTDCSHVVIHITNSGALTSLSGTFALTAGLNGATFTVPSGVIVAGSLPNPATASAYDNLIIIKAGFFTKLSLAYTASSGSGDLIVRVVGTNIDG